MWGNSANSTTMLPHLQFHFTFSFLSFPFLIIIFKEHEIIQKNKGLEEYL